MYAHESAVDRSAAPSWPALALDDLPLFAAPHAPAHGDDTDLRVRSTPFFRNALAHLILAAAQVQRAGGTQHIALRRQAKSPHILFTARFDGSDMAFATHVGIDGRAHVECADHGAFGRAPVVRRHALGPFDAPQALVAHRRAVAQFLRALSPALTLDDTGGLTDDADAMAADNGSVDAMPGRGVMQERGSFDAALAAFGMPPKR